MSTSNEHGVDVGPSVMERIRLNYVGLTGLVPLDIETRLRLDERSDRMKAVEAIELLRDELIMKNPLGRKVG
jgi:hypothetical protein